MIIAIINIKPLVMTVIAKSYKRPCDEKLTTIEATSIFIENITSDTHETF